MFEVGRLCVKIAGRDAGKECVVVDVIDDNFVLIDGRTRRRKCNLKHLEPLDKVLDIKKGASHDDVKKAFAAIGIEIVDSKPKEHGERPKKQKKKKVYEPKSKDKKEKSKSKAKQADDSKKESDDKSESKQVDKDKKSDNSKEEVAKKETKKPVGKTADKPDKKLEKKSAGESAEQ